MQKSDFSYHLPEHLIAQYPLENRVDSRLLVVNETLHDQQFKDIKNWLRAGDLLVLNNTRVIPARLFGHKPTGGKVEILIERVTGEYSACAHLRASKAPKSGTSILLNEQDQCVVEDREHDLFVLRFSRPVNEVLQQHGHMPLPPYMTRSDEQLDKERYQTVYNETPGAVAAPTAGLHFDQDLLQALNERGVNQAYVTLHVGSGTFQPVREENLDQHVMHKEWLSVSEQTVTAIEQTKANGGRVIAVGTTAMRSLESAAMTGRLAPYQGETDLFIRPGYRFNVVDALITNFHLSESTLLMLVSAFSGFHRMKQAYQHAIENEYRFFSYGDAMFLTQMDDIKGEIS